MCLWFAMYKMYYTLKCHIFALSDHFSDGDVGIYWSLKGLLGKDVYFYVR